MTGRVLPTATIVAASGDAVMRYEDEAVWESMSKRRRGFP
jgi:hypothetical protein